MMVPNVPEVRLKAFRSRIHYSQGVPNVPEVRFKVFRSRVLLQSREKEKDWEG